jgi:DNA-binding transcriptional LysR family regulator
VEDYRQLVGRLKEQERLPEIVRVAVGGSFAGAFPVALAAFREQYRTVAVRVQVCRGQERILGVARGEFDLALVTHTPEQVEFACSAPRLRVETLREQPLVVAALATSEDGQRLRSCPEKQPIPPAELLQLSLLGLDGQSGVRRQLDRALRGANVSGSLKFNLYPGGWATMLACARQGLGTAILPADRLAGSGAAFVVRQLPPEFQVADRVVWLAQPVNDRVATLVSCLKSAFAPPSESA